MSSRGSVFFLASRLQQELGRLLREAMDIEATSGLAPLEPRLDVLELPERLLILVEVPGVEPDAMHVHIEHGELHIRVRKAGRKHTVGEARYHCVECSRGSALRRVKLPAEFDSGRITARLADGVLEIEAPRIPAPEPGRREIEIRHE